VPALQYVVTMGSHPTERSGAGACTSLRAGLLLPGPGVDVDVVRAWRVPENDRCLWMRGITTSYRADPVGEYIIGIAEGRAYHLRRGRSTRVVRPGQLVVLDPSAAHSGSPAEGAAWAGRLLVIELPGPAGEDIPLATLRFPEPVIGDGLLARRFLALHHGMECPASALERQCAAWSFLADLAACSPDARPGVSRDDPAVRAAVEYLHDEITRNITLDELATASGAGKYQLVRRFNAAVGVPPHAYQVALRVNLARRLLERGERATDVAGLAGFVDQSHLNRHFRRRLGMTPAKYARSTRPSQPERSQYDPHVRRAGQHPRPVPVRE
jgi:AraC-like DNA-binding protein